MENTGIRLRLTALAMAVGVMGILIALTTLDSERRSAELRKQLKQVDSESFQIGEHFKDALREVTDKMTHYRAGHDPADWEEFIKSSHQLDAWIDEQKPKLNTPVETSILQRIDAAYDDYQRLAEELHASSQSQGDQSGSTTELRTPLTQSRRRLADLGQDLANAHFKLRNQVLSYASQNLAKLRRMLLGSLCLLFAFMIALAVMVYRDMIAPLQIKLMASQALAERQEKLASLGMLAAGVAHEIRNPLTAIKAALFIQQKKFRPGTQEHADAELVEREILRLERIVNDFLQFARPTEPQFTTIPADLPLREVQSLFASQLAQSNIQLILEESPSLRIKVDSAQIKQVLLNLVQNAADAIDRNGLIRLRVRSGRKILHDRETEVVILANFRHRQRHFSRSGTRRLFDPFFTTKETGTGTGVIDRLADCAETRWSTGVSNQGESRHRFWYCASAGNCMSNSAKILLIEDDSGITDTLRRVLIQEGHEVQIEERGDDGL